MRLTKWRSGAPTTKAPIKEMKGSELANLQITLPDAPSSALVFYRQK